MYSHALQKASEQDDQICLLRPAHIDRNRNALLDDVASCSQIDSTYYSLSYNRVENTPLVLPRDDPLFDTGRDNKQSHLRPHVHKYLCHWFVIVRDMNRATHLDTP